MIPKRIFYVWGVNDPKKRDVQVCIQTWRQIMPDYEIIELNEDNKKYFDYEKELRENKWFRTVYENKMWAYVADYIRIKVLYEHGGIYFDTDVSAVKPLDKFLKEKCFVGMQYSQADGWKDYVEPAILGAQKGNKFLKFILDIYNDDIWKLPIYNMPDLFSYTFKELYNKNLKSFGKRGKQKTIKYEDISVYPEGVFIPFRYGENFTPECVTDKTYTIHWFGGSWVKPEILYFLKNKHILPLKKLTKKNIHYTSIKRYCFPFTKITLVRFEQYETKNRITLFHIIPLLDITNKWVKLFGFLPIMSVKRG
jgi:mannosyltransferase OCH1-like enzyme